MMILKFRRLGFSLEEIKEYLSHYQPDKPNAQQYRDGIDKIQRRIGALQTMRVEIDEALAELTAMEEDARARLAEAETSEAAAARQMDGAHRG